MKFHIKVELDYTTIEPCTFVLNIHALRSPQTILKESFIVDTDHAMEELVSIPEGNRLIRITIPQSGEIHFSYEAMVENAYTIINYEDLPETPVAELNPFVLTYLYPSRYCQSDKLFRLANHQFGKIENPFSKVLAITEWIYQNVEYLSGSTNAETSAYDTVSQQAGVCRDFAHLGIALCRALTIPARYCTVYSYKLKQPDFHACFEAYLYGKWVVFDATRLAPLNGFVKISTGRDAADTAIANLFGNIRGNSIKVNSELNDGVFEPMFYDTNKCEGISYGWHA